MGVDVFLVWTGYTEKDAEYQIMNKGGVKNEK